MKSLYDKIAPCLSDGTRSLEMQSEGVVLVPSAICSAIRWAVSDGLVDSDTAENLLAKVSEGISPHSSVNSWLAWHRHDEDLKGLTTEERCLQLQAYRHRWLKYLCERHELQEVFTKVARHLLKQNARSTDGNDWCRYRQGKLMCAVGCLIPDELYTPRIEDKGVKHKLVEDLLGKIVNLTPAMRELLVELQSIHDEATVTNWKARLQELAKRRNLEMPEDV